MASPDDSPPSKYTWKDEQGTIEISFDVPAGTGKRQIDHTLTKDTIRMGIKGKPPMIEGRLFDSIKFSTALLYNPSPWYVEEDDQGTKLKQVLKKVNPFTPWTVVIKGSREGAPDKIDFATIDTCSLFELSKLMINPDGFQLCCIAAEKNLEPALEMAGEILTEVDNSRYSEGEYGKLPNMPLGVKYLKSAVDIWSSTTAMLRLGEVEERQKNFKGAEFWYLKAAKCGRVSAFYEVARVMEENLKGKSMFVQSISTFVEWYQKAAQNKNPKAYLRLGQLYLDGTVQLRDVDQALFYFAKARELDSKLAVPTPEEVQEIIRMKEEKENRVKLPTTQKVTEAQTTQSTQTTQSADYSSWMLGIGVVVCAAVVGGFIYSRLSVK